MSSTISLVLFGVLVALIGLVVGLSVFFSHLEKKTNK